MLRVEDLVVRYGAATALDGVSLQVDTGEMVALVGPNGAGKSTLINTVSGLLRPASGSVTCEGRVAQVPEGRQMFPDMSVEDNLVLGGWSIRNKRVDEVFDLFPDLATMRTRKAGRLSGGQQQMVAVGRALMTNPRLLMLDEPSLGIAPRLVTAILEALVSINRAGVGILLVEQNVHAALGHAHRGYVLESGRIVAQGSGADLLRDEHIRRAYLGPLAVRA
jgi:branched-chain amino acid transport system ATP-binding protein